VFAEIRMTVSARAGEDAGVPSASIPRSILSQDMTADLSSGSGTAPTPFPLLQRLHLLGHAGCLTQENTASRERSPLECLTDKKLSRLRGNAGSRAPCNCRWLKASLVKGTWSSPSPVGLGHRGVGLDRFGRAMADQLPKVMA